MTLGSGRVVVRFPVREPTAPREAPAANRPCEMRRYHYPRVVRSVGHHRWPQYLQRRVWDEIRDGTPLIDLCDNDHAAVHEWLSWLLGEARRPNPEPDRRCKGEAQQAFDWFIAACLEAGRDTNGRPVVRD